MVHHSDTILVARRVPLKLISPFSLEIWTKIVGFLANNTTENPRYTKACVTACSRVCKQFRALCIPHLFKIITVGAREAGNSACHCPRFSTNRVLHRIDNPVLEDFKDFVKAHPTLVAGTQTLNIHLSSHCTSQLINAHDYFSLLSYFPNLCHLSLRNLRAPQHPGYEHARDVADALKQYGQRDLISLTIDVDKVVLTSGRADMPCYAPISEADFAHLVAPFRSATTLSLCGKNVAWRGDVLRSIVRSFGSWKLIVGHLDIALLRVKDRKLFRGVIETALAGFDTKKVSLSTEHSNVWDPVMILESVIGLKTAERLEELCIEFFWGGRLPTFPSTARNLRKLTIVLPSHNTVDGITELARCLPQLNLSLADDEYYIGMTPGSSPASNKGYQAPHATENKELTLVIEFYPHNMLRKPPTDHADKQAWVAAFKKLETAIIKYGAGLRHVEVCVTSNLSSDGGYLRAWQAALETLVKGWDRAGLFVECKQGRPSVQWSREYAVMH